jgi:predicted metalloprotease with PDZ domain
VYVLTIRGVDDIYIIVIEEKKNDLKRKMKMNENELRNSLAEFTKGELLDLAVDLLLNEQEMRKELDKVQNIIR